jgi:hypothetical protein
MRRSMISRCHELNCSTHVNDINCLRNVSLVPETSTVERRGRIYVSEVDKGVTDAGR